jgi:hypothetical protein
LPLDFSKCLIFQCFLFLLQKWDKFLPLQNQRLMNLTPCDRLHWHNRMADYYKYSGDAL